MGNAEPPESMADGYGEQQRAVQAERAVMTLMTVPAASIAGMVFSLVVSFALPIGPVSYTHLDVYKRQSSPRCS